MIAHRCASCLDELPRTARRFVVFIPASEEADMPSVDLKTHEVVAQGREAVVCEACVGWYHDGSIEVTLGEVEN